MVEVALSGSGGTWPKATFRSSEAGGVPGPTAGLPFEAGYR